MTDSLVIAPMPSYDAPSLEWALWYLSLGLLPLPIRSEAVVEEYMQQLLAEQPGLTEKQIADARESAGKRPCVKWAGGVWAQRGVSEAQAREWFEGHPDRRIYLLTGVGSGLTDVDVDTYKGGNPEPWASLAGVVVTTPQGGRHCWFAEHEQARTNSQKIAEGVDVRGRGGGCVAPSGRSTPERRFERWEWPLRQCPEAALKPVRKDRTASTPASATSNPRTDLPPGTGPDGQPRLLLHAPVGLTFAEAVSTPRPDGTRMESGKLIVGMLCRRAPLPDDAVAAALAMLDVWLGTWVGGRVVRVGWEAALRSPEPRSQEFVVEFVSMWNAIRCTPPWPDAGERSARLFAASMWSSATAAEDEARAAAEPPARLVPPQPAASTTGPAAVELDEAADTAASIEVSAPQVDLQAWLRDYAFNSALDYTAADIEARRHRELLSCEALPPWLGADGTADLTTPWGHGWGPWLDNTFGGGLAPGFLWVLVARRAKGGKTAFVDQHLAGLQMLGAWNLAQGHGPVPLVWVVTEMPFTGLEDRSVARYVGFDQGVFRRGKKAELAPGIRDVAFREHVAPSVVASRMWDRAKNKLASRDVWSVGRGLRWTLKIGSLPAESRTGPNLVAAVSDLVGYSIQDLSQRERIDPERVIPVVLFDPVQRHQRAQRKAEDALPGDEMIMAVRDSTDAQRWITAVTSDTNQASARAGATDTAKTPDAIVASACRGTYSVLHLADLVAALDVLPLSDAERRLQITERRDLERQARVWVGLSRWSEGADHPLPFRYFPRTGRFVAVDPAPAPPPAAPPPPQTRSADPTAHQDPPPVERAAQPTLTLTAPRPRRAKKTP